MMILHVLQLERTGECVDIGTTDAAGTVIGKVRLSPTR